MLCHYSGCKQISSPCPPNLCFGFFSFLYLMKASKVEGTFTPLQQSFQVLLGRWWATGDTQQDDTLSFVQCAVADIHYGWAHSASQSTAPQDAVFVSQASVSREKKRSFKSRQQNHTVEVSLYNLAVKLTPWICDVLQNHQALQDSEKEFKSWTPNVPTLWALNRAFVVLFLHTMLTVEFEINKKTKEKALPLWQIQN